MLTQLRPVSPVTYGLTDSDFRGYFCFTVVHPIFLGKNSCGSRLPRAAPSSSMVPLRRPRSWGLGETVCQLQTRCVGFSRKTSQNPTIHAKGNPKATGKSCWKPRVPYETVGLFQRRCAPIPTSRTPHLPKPFFMRKQLVFSAAKPACSILLMLYICVFVNIYTYIFICWIYIYIYIYWIAMDCLHVWRSFGSDWFLSPGIHEEVVQRVRRGRDSQLDHKARTNWFCYGRF